MERKVEIFFSEQVVYRNAFLYLEPIWFVVKIDESA